MTPDQYFKGLDIKNEYIKHFPEFHENELYQKIEDAKKEQPDNDE